jgi:hypothetical protein
MNVYVVITVAMVMLLTEFGPYGIIFMNVCCHNCCHGNALKEFWDLWDRIILTAMCLLL